MAQIPTLPTRRVDFHIRMSDLKPSWRSTLKRAVETVAMAMASCCAAVAPAADWPQWQGPDRNSISKEAGLLKEWPTEGPPLAWKIKGLGGGYSAPSIAAGRIYGLSNRGDEQVVWALSEADGKEIWVTPLAAPFNQRMPQGNEGPGCTPTVDDDRLYVLGLGGELACLQAADGKIIWQRNLVQDFGGRVPTWAYRESPLVDGDKVICTPGAQEASMVALNKTTGDVMWKSQPPALPAAAPGGTPAAGDGARGREGGGRREQGDRGGRGGFGAGRGGFGRGRGGFGGSGAAYSSAIAIDFEGQRQYVQLTSNALIGVAASDGKFLWRYDRPANRNGINCTTPLYHDGHVFASSAYGAGGGLAKLTNDQTGNIKAEEVWFSSRLQNHHGGVILHDGALYGANGGNEGGALICLDFKTGEVLWDERGGERRAPKGSVAFADDRLYYRTESGPILLIEPNREKYVERGRFEQPDRSRSPAWSHPVIANGKLYIRDQDVLLAYDIKAK